MAKNTLMICILMMVSAASLTPAAAHEFWVAPQDYTPLQGNQVVVALKNGQRMKGADYPYLSDRFQSFTITTRQGTRRAQGMDGDIPALTFIARQPGLHIIAYHSKPLRITYVTFDEFAKYLDYEGLGNIAAEHQKRGLPQSGFSERYIRCAKGLIQVGPVGAKDRDRPTGLPFELVATVNPYVAGINKLPVLLLWQGKPVAGRQISVFRRNAATVTRSIVFTDKAGRAEIPLTGGGTFLLNAVNFEALEDGRVLWQSHWASLTFNLPSQN